MDFDIQRIALLAVPILIAVTFHELAHGWVAYRLGDNTAKQAGRLTLNPIKHLDLFGTLAFIITNVIGWAKPVPVDPRNFVNPRKDMIWVAAAGPLANMILAVFFAGVYQLLYGASTAMPVYFYLPVIMIAKYAVFINVGLAVFNLLPIPPLDGSRILVGLLPRDLAYRYAQIEKYGFIILLALILTNAVNYTIVPIIRVIIRILGVG